MSGRVVYVVISLVFIVFSITSAKAKRLALVVGNDDYKSVAKLQKAVNDSRAIARALKGLGFEVVQIENANNRKMTLEIFGNFVSKIEKGDEALFYYAGHGVEVRGRNFLLATDIPAVKPNSERVIIKEAFAVDEIMQAMEEKGARVSILILDACRDNPFPKQGTRSLGTSRGLGRSDPPKGTFVMYSAGSRQAALDRLSDEDAHPNSVYTRKLLPLLKTPGLSLGELAKALRRDVEKLANSVGHEQFPAFYDQLRGSYQFTPGVGKKKSEPRVSAEVADRALWDSIKTSKRQSDFRFYLKEYPNGIFSSVARLKLSRLDKPPKPDGLDIRNPKRERGVDYHYVGPVYPPDPWLSLLTAPRNGREIMRMRQGTLFRVLETRGKWFKVRLRDGRTGWAHSGWIRCCRKVSEAVRRKVSSYHYVIHMTPPDPWLALRTEPTTRRGRRIMKMPSGTLLTLLRSRGKWRQVQLRDGTTGWAHGGWIRCCRTVSE